MTYHFFLSEGEVYKNSPNQIQVGPVLLSIQVPVDGFISLVHTTVFSIPSNLNWLKIGHLFIWAEYSAMK